MDYSRLLSALPTPADESAWYDVIGKLKSKVKEFSVSYNRLNKISIDPLKFPALAQEKADLINRGNYLRTKIQDITGAVDSGWNWLKSSIGLDGIQSAGLGLPLIPVAVVVGVIGLLTKYIGDEVRFYKKVNLAETYIKKGYSPQQASEIVNKLENKTDWFNFGQIAPVAFIGGLGLLAYLNRNKLRG